MNNNNLLGIINDNFISYENSEDKKVLCQNKITNNKDRMCIDSTGDKIVITVMENEENDIDFTDDLLWTGSTDEESTVTLSSTTPADWNIPSNTEGVPLLAVDITAGSTDIILSNIRIKYNGSNSLSNLSLYLNNERVSDELLMNTFDEYYLEWNIDFNNETVIQAGETKILLIKADIGNSTQDESHQIILKEINTDSNTNNILIEDISSWIFTTNSIASLESIELNIIDRDLVLETEYKQFYINHN